METKNFIKRRFEKTVLLIIMFFSSVIALAQDATKPVDVDVTTTETTRTTTTEEWVSNPLYWVIGALVLILIIALVARGNRNNA